MDKKTKPKNNEASLVAVAEADSDESSLKPSERFVRVAKTVFGVKKEQVAEYSKAHPPEPQKRGRKPKAKDIKEESPACSLNATEINSSRR